jgi:transcriptional regulator with XRE-family HTH domain
MPVISKRFADELNEKEMRDAYLDEKTRTKIALQIRALRSQRGWSQTELGQKMNKPQSNVARLEDRDIARYTLTTLLELASAYDCGLIVEFVPYEQFLRRTNDLSPQKLETSPFSRDALDALCQDTSPAVTLAQFRRILVRNREKSAVDALTGQPVRMLSAEHVMPHLGNRTALAAAFPSYAHASLVTSTGFVSAPPGTGFATAAVNYFTTFSTAPDDPEKAELRRQLADRDRKIADQENELAGRDKRIATLEAACLLSSPGTEDGDTMPMPPAVPIPPAYVIASSWTQVP